jgi:hypothetical protein
MPFKYHMQHGIQIINPSVQSIEHLMLAEWFRAFCSKKYPFRVRYVKSYWIKYVLWLYIVYEMSQLFLLKYKLAGNPSDRLACDTLQIVDHTPQSEMNKHWIRPRQVNIWTLWFVISHSTCSVPRIVGWLDARAEWVCSLQPVCISSHRVPANFRELRTSNNTTRWPTPRSRVEMAEIFGIVTGVLGLLPLCHGEL